MVTFEPGKISMYRYLEFNDFDRKGEFGVYVDEDTNYIMIIAF